MKIIFDNEKQKKLFLKVLGSSGYCPSEVDFFNSNCGINLCEKCWEQSIQ